MAVARASLLVLAVAAAIAGTGCNDSADSRTTARIHRLEGSRACLVPEDSDQDDLEGCFPITAGDAQRLKPGSCISVVIPNQLDSERRDDPLRSIEVLDRDCKR
jgi:hypothetical protein